jgi:hypothetical protein
MVLIRRKPQCVINLSHSAVKKRLVVLSKAFENDEEEGTMQETLEETTKR